MPVTQQDFARQMIRQLRILDPSASAELGTPERKLIDTFAQALADAQIDLTVLASDLNIDSKFGAKLDEFLSIFNFSRQQGAAAMGIIEFSREIPSSLDIRIPLGTQVTVAPVSIGTGNLAQRPIFQTTSDTFLVAGSTSVLVPIRSQTIGSFNNLGANTLIEFVSSPISGITGVTNPTPTTGGLDAESDAELKVRFKNTLFRNLAGTQDQYLALAIAGAFTNKAIVIGPISRFREYVQVPPVDDETPYDAGGTGTADAGNGAANQFSTALSTLTYADHTYDNVPSFISNGQAGASVLFYTEGSDFVVNTVNANKNKGDAYRLSSAGIGDNPLTADHRPSVTLYNVYTGADELVEAVRPSDVVLFEHSYMSTASRNDYDRSITNCVDIYLNGANETPATTVIPKPTASNLFVNNVNHRLHFDNYRRIGDPDARPLLGNVFSPLYWNPLESVPESLVIGTATYLEGTHYWGIIDVSEVGGTIRAKTGIEWAAGVKGLATEDETVYTGPTIIANSATSVEVTDYTFDKNILDIQSAVEGQRQVTADALVHKATIRYFKFDISVMYTPGASIADANQSIQLVVNNYLTSLYFGSQIQLSDIIQAIHNVPQVDNVRWSAETDPLELNRVTEANRFGVPRAGVVIDNVTTGSSSPAVSAVQQFYLTGTPTGGTFVVTHDGDSSLSLAYNAVAASIDVACSVNFSTGVTVTGTGTPADPFRFTFDTPGFRPLIDVVTDFNSTTTIFNEDFTLKDNEQAALPTEALSTDTLPGLKIRPRAQSTWRRRD